LVPIIAGAPGAYYLPFSGYAPAALKTYPYNVYSPRARYYTYPTYPLRNVVTPAALNINSGDIIAQTRTLAESVKATLRQLAADPKSSVIVSRIINDENNVCIRNLDDGLAGIEQATRLVEAAGNDIKALVAKVQTFTSLSEPATVVREVGAILRILEPLVNNIAPEKPIICQASPDQAFASLRNLAVLVDELSTTRDLALTPQGRGQLKQSANVIVAVTTFITKLRANFLRFQQVCTADKQYNIEAINAVGDLMVDLADMFGALGGVQQGEKIRNGKAFVNRVVGELNKIGNLGLGELDCNHPGDFRVAADTLEGLATIIDEFGIENLEQQLGIDLSFVFKYSP